MVTPARLRSMATWKHLLASVSVTDTGTGFTLGAAEDFLNEQGELGWEPVSMTTDPADVGRVIVLFKKSADDTGDVIVSDLK